MIDPNFWRGKNVFLTGHTGFKGAWTSLLMERLGAHVCGYSLPPRTTPSLFALTGGAHSESHIADIRDGTRLACAMQDFRPEIVIHMAAQSLVRRSYREPEETFAVNVMGTANVLEAIRQTPEVRAALIITSDKVYDLSQDTTPRKEGDPLGGVDPYSASKAAAEILIQSYRQSFFGGGQSRSDPQIASARSGNVIGGGDWSEDRIVTDVVSALHSGSDAVLRYPDSIRPWLFVLDTLAGYLMLIERLYSGEAGFASAWNFGPLPGAEMRVRELVEEFVGVWGAKCGWRLAEDPQLPEAPQLRLDVERAVTNLGWRPSLSQRDAIVEAASWYSDFLERQIAPALLCSSAIDRQFARLSIKLESS